MDCKYPSKNIKLYKFNFAVAFQSLNGKTKRIADWVRHSSNSLSASPGQTRNSPPAATQEMTRMSINKKINDFLSQLVRKEDGVTAIEYGLIAALIAVGIATILGTIGTNLTSTFTTISDKL
jgi:pilus assembly protein Flp/PilA